MSERMQGTKARRKLTREQIPGQMEKLEGGKRGDIIRDWAGEEAAAEVEMLEIR